MEQKQDPPTCHLQETHFRTKRAVNEIETST